MHWGIRYLLMVISGLAIISGVAHASAEEFFKGKTIHIIVGFSAGGGFDTYARVISRHLAKHIPGDPTVIVDNMTGAGSLIAANHVYSASKPDGLTIGNFMGGLFMAQVLGRTGIQFDARKFEYVGVPVKDSQVCVLVKASGITSMEKWMVSKTPVKLGGTAPGDTTVDVPKILKAALGLPIRLVSGYKGTPEIALAASSGELGGLCGSTWSSVKKTWAEDIRSGNAVVALQTVAKAHSELPQAPLAIDFARTREAQQLIQTGIHDLTDILRPYVLPPGTPRERVQILRTAFEDTMRDQEFIADARKANLDLDPITGEQLENTVARLFKLDPPMVARLKEALK